MRFKLFPSFGLFIVRDTLGVYPDSKPLTRDQASRELFKMSNAVSHEADELLASVGASTTATLKQHAIDARKRGLEITNWRSNQISAILSGLDEFDALPLWRKIYWMLYGAKLGGVARARMDDVKCPPPWHWSGENKHARNA